MFSITNTKYYYLTEIKVLYVHFVFNQLNHNLTNIYYYITLNRCDKFYIQSNMTGIDFPFFSIFSVLLKSLFFIRYIEIKLNDINDIIEKIEKTKVNFLYLL